MVARIKEKFPEVKETSNQEDVSLIIKKDSLLDIMKFVKVDSQLSFDLLIDICGVDYLGNEPRFEVVYHLVSTTTKKRLRLKVPVMIEDLRVPSITSIWKSAGWFEREVYDMYGINFDGHPDLRRILMPYNFKDYPLRKDFPLKGKVEPHLRYGASDIRLDWKK